MPVEKFTTTLVPFECKPFYNGVNPRTQKQFTIYQVRARDMQGAEITKFPLRSFEPLTLHETMQVEAQLYDGGDRYGISYTLKPVGETKITNSERIAKLESQVAALYEHLNLTPDTAPKVESERMHAAAPPPAPSGPPPSPPAPAPPVAAPPPMPPVQPQPAGGAGSQFGDEPPF